MEGHGYWRFIHLQYRSHVR